jgi:hypothetical protein
MRTRTETQDIVAPIASREEEQPLFPRERNVFSGKSALADLSLPEAPRPWDIARLRAIAAYHLTHLRPRQAY